MSERLGLAADWNPDFPQTPGKPTPLEFRLLFSLAGFGMEDCPWGWDDDFVEKFGEDTYAAECTAALTKIREFLVSQGYM